MTKPIPGRTAASGAVLLGTLMFGSLPNAVTAQDASPPKEVVQEPVKADPKARLKSLNEEVEAAITAWRKKAREAAAAKGTEKTVPAVPMRPDFAPLVAKFQAAATDYAGTDDAVPFLVWLIQSGGDRKATSAALGTIAKTHAGSDELASLGPMFPYMNRMPGMDADAAKGLLDAIVAKNTNADVLGWVKLTRFGPTVETADRESDEYAKARAELMAYADKVEDRRLASELRSKVELREKYGNGNIAPDIVGVDLDGVEFKLSDYKGKVVFLDFWGDW